MNNPNRPDSDAGQPRSHPRVPLVVLPVLLLLIPLGAWLIIGRGEPCDQNGSASVHPQTPVVLPSAPTQMSAMAMEAHDHPLPIVSGSRKPRGVGDRLSPLPFDQRELEMFHSLKILHEDGRAIVRVKLTEHGDELTIDAKTGRLLSIDGAKPPMNHS